MLSQPTCASCLLVGEKYSLLPLYIKFGHATWLHPTICEAWGQSLKTIARLIHSALFPLPGELNLGL